MKRSEEGAGQKKFLRSTHFREKPAGTRIFIESKSYSTTSRRDNRTAMHVQGSPAGVFRSLFLFSPMSSSHSCSSPLFGESERHTTGSSPWCLSPAGTSYTSAWDRAGKIQAPMIGIPVRLKTRRMPGNFAEKSLAGFSPAGPMAGPLTESRIPKPAPLGVSGRGARSRERF
ncbi:MAG: hypothetical protein METHP_02024 [Methanoregula sp. SKADARSKE-2]|nr:MAG: hypothetical protein METHP_02024 [Methanoregula sp. SKADARSKE-2]